MSPSRMVPFAFSEGVTLYCPYDGRFSFFNSPYYSHGCFTGVDIYPPSEVWYGDAAYSPVNGEVVKIRSVGHFSSKSFQCPDKDYVIIIKCRENPDRVVKILHVEPTVNEGDAVKAGDKIGKYLRSGFFHFWTDPHVHLEVRNIKDPVRARGGYPIQRTMPLTGDCEPLQSLKGTVILRRPEYGLLSLESASSGVTVEVDGEVGVLEGGIPHYGFFGVHLNEAVNPGSNVKLCGINIGIVKAIHGNMGIAKYAGPVFRLNGEKVCFSLYVYVQKPLLKVIPSKLGGITVNEGEKAEITL